MANERLRAPYFKIAFKGPVGTLSEGTWKNGTTGRAYVDIGPYRLRRVMLRDNIDSALSEASDDPDVVIRVGHLLAYRWVLSVTSGEHTERQGLFFFLLVTLCGAFVHFIVLLLLAVYVSDYLYVGTPFGLIVVFGLAPKIALLVLLLLAARWLCNTWMNFAALFGSWRA